MDNNKLQQMQNWKKQIIMDPVLNYLFDTTQDPQDFLHTRILTLQHQQIVNIYSKLASLKHSISKNIQKEVQIKHTAIQSSFRSLQNLHHSFPKQQRNQLETNLKYLEKYNKKYQTVSKSIIQWKNTTKAIHYAQALQNFQVDSKLLKSMLKDFKQSDQKQVFNTLKVSKIIKNLTDLSTKFDFSGIQIFQNQKSFIKSSRENVYELIDKQLNSFLFKGKNSDEQIRQKLIILKNLNKLTQFVTTFYKSKLKDLGQCLKKAFNGTLHSEFSQLCLNKSNTNSLIFKMNNLAKTLLYIQQIFQEMKISNVLLNNGIPNLFIKMWDTIIQYFKQILKWCTDQQTKQKQKNRQKLLIWKYPIIFHMLTTFSDEIHLQMIQNNRFNYYNFLSKKQDLIFILINLANQFYKAVDKQWNKFISLFDNNKTDYNAIKGLISNNQINMINFMKFLIPKIKNSKILKQILSRCQIYMNKIRQIAESHNLIQQYNDFLYDLKMLFIQNPELQINHPSQIYGFKLLAEPDFYKEQKIQQTEIKQKQVKQNYQNLKNEQLSNKKVQQQQQQVKQVNQ